MGELREHLAGLIAEGEEAIANLTAQLNRQLGYTEALKRVVAAIDTDAAEGAE